MDWRWIGDVETKVFGRKAVSHSAVNWSLKAMYEKSQKLPYRIPIPTCCRTRSNACVESKRRGNPCSTNTWQQRPSGTEQFRHVSQFRSWPERRLRTSSSTSTPLDVDDSDVRRQVGDQGCLGAGRDPTRLRSDRTTRVGSRSVQPTVRPRMRIGPDGTDGK